MPFDETKPRSSWVQTGAAVAQQLAGLHGPAEEAFLAVGGRLAEANRAALGLVGMAQRLAGRFNAGSDGAKDYSDALTELDGARHVTAQFASWQGGGGDSFGNILSAAEGIKAALTHLQRYMGRVAALAVSARIEAARLDGEGLDFTVFTQGIHHLAVRGQGVLAEAEQNLETMRRAVAESASDRQAFIDLHLTELGQMDDRLGRSLGALRSHQHDAAQVLDRLPGDMAQVRQAIAGLVSDLQIGDATRQRIEHVEHALSAMGQACTEQEGLDGEQVPLLVNAVCDLQSHQLTAIEAEFTTKSQAIENDLRKLASGLGAIQDRIEGIHAGQAEGGFLADIDADIASVGAMVEGFGQACSKGARLLATAAQASDSLARSMQAINDIDADFNIIGLNASIKCGNMGGRAGSLNVIAQELRACAKETRSLAEIVSRHLEAIHRASAEMQAQSRDDHANELSALTHSLDHSLTILERMEADTAGDLTEMREIAQAIVHSLTGSAAGFTIRLHHSAIVRDAVESLGACARQTDPHLPADRLDQARRDVLLFMESRYTMASERQIHQALFGDGGGHAPAAEENVDDLLF